MQITKKPWPFDSPSRLSAFFFVPILQLLFTPTTIANPLPTGHQPIHGNISISQEGNFLKITTDSHRTISHWESFDISQGYTVNFIQPSPQSAHLSRVIGSNPSHIYGTLQSNGSIYLINPNGILIGPSGTIQTHGGLLSTLDVANHHFLNSTQSNFIGNPKSQIHILGKIHSTGDSFTILSPNIHIAPNAQILAPNGRVQIGASDKIELLIRPDNALGTYIRVNTNLLAPPKGTIDIAGKITAQDIAILSAGNPYAYAIRLHPEATIHALGTTDRPGNITIHTPTGSIQQEGTLLAPSGQTRILSPQGKIQHSGTIDVSSNKEEIRRATSLRGGLIDILADEVELAALSKLLAQGKSNGGTIRVGGSWQGNDRTLPHARSTTIHPNAIINASSIAHGNGGTVVVWADHSTQFHGTILAQGADAGDGGRVEVSGRDYLNFSGHVSTQSPSGHKGLLLLDPENIQIITGSHTFPPGFHPEDPVWGSNEDPAISTLSVSVLEAILKENTVTLDAKNDITVSAPITWDTNSSLWINAGRNITIQAPITHNFLGGFSAGINLQADTDNDGNGTLWIQSPITQKQNPINLVGASLRIDAPVSVTGIGGEIKAVALHGSIQSHLSLPVLKADFIDLIARDGIYGTANHDSLMTEASFSISAELTSSGDIRLLNLHAGTPKDLIFVNQLYAPLGSIYFTHSGGSSLYLNITNDPWCAYASDNLSLFVQGDAAKNYYPHLIINHSVYAGGRLLAVADGDISIGDGVTISTPSHGGGKVTLAVGTASPEAFAKAKLTNSGLIESGSDLEIHVVDPSNVKLGKTAVAGKIQFLNYRYTHNGIVSDHDEKEYQLSSSSSASSMQASSKIHSSSSSLSSSSSNRMESYRSDFSRSSQSSSSIFYSATSQASSSSSSYFSSRQSHSQSHSGPPSQEARSSSSQSMSRASSSSQSNFSFVMQSASSSSSSHFSSHFPDFKLQQAAAQFSTPPPAPRLIGNASPLATDLPAANRYLPSQDPNKLWLSPFYQPETISLSAEFLYPDNAISIGGVTSSLAFSELPETLVASLSPAIRRLLMASIKEEASEPEPIPPRRRVVNRPVIKPKPPASSAQDLPTLDEVPSPEPPNQQQEAQAPFPKPTPAYGSGVVLTDDGRSLPLDPASLPEALKNAVSKAVRANLEEAITADDYP